MAKNLSKYFWSDENKLDWIIFNALLFLFPHTKFFTCLFLKGNYFILYKLINYINAVMWYMTLMDTKFGLQNF